VGQDAASKAHHCRNTNVVGNSFFGQMRLRLLIILLQLTLTNAFGQIDVELYFKSSCNDSIYKLSFNVIDLSANGQYINSVDNKVDLPKAGTYHLFTSFVKGDFVHIVDPDIVITDRSKQVDTLLMPKIKFTTGAELHTKFWSYFNCDKPCNDRETDFYENGNKRFEGDFMDGKPKWFVEYRADGTKKEESWYTVGNYFPDKLSQYNDKGQLTVYETKEFKKRKTITSTYDSNDKLLMRQVKKH